MKAEQIIYADSAMETLKEVAEIKFAILNQFFARLRIIVLSVSTKIALKIAQLPVQTWQQVIQCLLVVCLASCGARLFWLIIPSPQIPAASLNLVTPIQPSSVNEASVNIEQLKSLNLFGAPPPSKQAVTSDLTPSGITQLNLSLVGVMESNIEEYARAIIVDGNHPEVYAVGAQIAGGNDVRLVKVLNDSVIINNQGNLEILYLYADGPHKKENFVATSPRKAQENSMAQIYDNVQEEASPLVQRPQLNYPEQAVTAIERGTSAIAALSPVNENGKMLGFKVSQGADAEKFKSIGLQNGDVIVAINGWPADSKEKLLEMYQNLGERTSLSVDIKRGKNIVSAELPIQ